MHIMHKFMIIFFLLCDKDHFTIKTESHCSLQITLGNSIIIYFVCLSAASPPSSGSCRDDEIYCDGQCYPPSIRCNGYPECRNGIDESNCPASTTQSPVRIFLFFQNGSEFQIMNFLFYRNALSIHVPVVKLVILKLTDVTVIQNVVMDTMRPAAQASLKVLVAKRI